MPPLNLQHTSVFLKPLSHAHYFLSTVPVFLAEPEWDVGQVEINVFSLSRKCAEQTAMDCGDSIKFLLDVSWPDC